MREVGGRESVHAVEAPMPLIIPNYYLWRHVRHRIGLKLFKTTCRMSAFRDLRELARGNGKGREGKGRDRDGWGVELG